MAETDLLTKTPLFCPTVWGETPGWGLPGVQPCGYGATGIGCAGEAAGKLMVTIVECCDGSQERRFDAEVAGKGLGWPVKLQCEVIPDTSARFPS